MNDSQIFYNPVDNNNGIHCLNSERYLTADVPVSHKVIRMFYIDMYHMGVGLIRRMNQKSSVIYSEECCVNEAFVQLLFIRYYLTKHQLLAERVNETIRQTGLIRYHIVIGSHIPIKVAG